MSEVKTHIDRYKAFFFDFDGVIVDSVDIKTRAFAELFKDYGEEAVRKVVDYHLNNGGVSRYEKFRYYYKNILNREITDEIMDGLDERYSRLVVEKVVEAPFIKGAIDFIKKINQSGRDCFIISATPKKEIEDITTSRRIGKYFKEIVGSPRTKKENLKYLLDKYDIDSEKAIYFGDARGDYEAAEEENIDFIGIVNEHSKELKGLGRITKIEYFNPDLALQGDRNA